VPNGPHTLLLFPLVRSFTAKGIYFHEPFQGLNLNRRSISGLEPEMPVTMQIGECLLMLNDYFYLPKVSMILVGYSVYWLVVLIGLSFN
jgi:hypothetical protein